MHLFKKLVVLCVILGSTACHSMGLDEYLGKQWNVPVEVVEKIKHGLELVSGMGVDPYIVLAIAEQESSYRPGAVASSGSRGLMQVVPYWHKAKIKGRDIFDPIVNIEVGAMVYVDCLKRWKLPERVLRCYNGGGTPGYEKRVLARLENIKKLVQLNFLEKVNMARMTIVGAGGAGINIASHFVGTGEAGYADVDVFAVDTSRSNLTDKIDPTKVYLFDGLDGSGKLRKSNYEAISERAKELVQRIGTTDIVNVVHSGSGGSGSVVSPVIVAELIKQKRPVIVTVIGSTGSRIETENTLKTLKSYASISESSNNPIAVSYFENSPESPRGKTDADVKGHIILTSLFWSGQHKELDRSDLLNFLDYTKVTTFKPTMVALDFHDGTEINLNKDEAIVTMVTLTDDETSPDVKHPIEYQAVGFLPGIVKQNSKLSMPVHMTLVANAFSSVVGKLETKLKDYNDARSAVVQKTIMAGEDTTKEGIVL